MKAVNLWLTSEKMNEFEQWYMKYINHVSSFKDQTSSAKPWEDNEMQDFKDRCKEHGMYDNLF